MLRNQEIAGAAKDVHDPFLSITANLPDLDDGIALSHLDDSTMSDWLDRFDTNGDKGDELLSVTELLGLSDSGLIGAEGDFQVKSPEKFQDLKFTSTPKSKTKADSGFGEESSANKSIEYKVVLNDITDKLKSQFFTSLSDVCEYSPNLKVSSQEGTPKTPLKRPSHSNENAGKSQDATEKVWERERNVSIIRRTIRTLPPSRPANILMRAASLPSSYPPSTSSASLKDAKRPRKKRAPQVQQQTGSLCGKCKAPLNDSGETEISEGELLYYTGIKRNKSALGVVKFMRLPEFAKVSSFKRILLTIMKLRFDFPYEDLSYRLRELLQVTKQIVSSTATIMGTALTDFIPWLEPPTIKRDMKRTFFLHEIVDSEMKIVILLEDKAYLPICYVSEPYDPSFDAIQIVTATCSNHFVDNDLICTLAAENPLFYRIHRTETATNHKLAEGRVNESAVEAFLIRNRAVIAELESYTFTDIKRRVAEDTILFEVGLKICCALVNVNYLPEESLLSYLQQVFARSSQLAMSQPSYE